MDAPLVGRHLDNLHGRAVHGADVRTTFRRTVVKDDDMKQDAWRRMFAKRKIEDGHWIWTGEQTKKIGDGGYGRTSYAGKKIRVHRLAWELTHGPIPEGKCVLHKCDIPLCFNPECLFLGTHADNMADMIAKGRARHPAGSEHRLAILTEDQVIEMRQRRQAGETTFALADAFGVCSQHVSRICIGGGWKKTEGPLTRSLPERISA